MEINFLIIFDAFDFAAEKHKLQRRKGNLRIPYINHPIKVGKLLAEAGEKDIELLAAAILHDTLEDTETTTAELEEKFGSEITGIVIELTDDMSLPDNIRKEKQVQKASSLSPKAKLIKIADKICNINDLLVYPIYWTKARKIRYIEWSAQVIEKCKGLNTVLDQKFEEIYKKGLSQLRK
jgi:GTP diphosphokinase / guanosine-3',5'-bis(diphosphate) 3'-diphosphatase